MVIGFFGGAFSANTGAGTDMLAFIVLTLAFGIDEKISTPTSVVIMGINSLIGAFMYGVVLQDVGIASSYWLVAAPIVILGAPLGAFVVSIVKRDHLILFILFLVGVELTTTIWLIPFTRTITTVVFIAVAICIVWFSGMLYYRHRVIARLDVASALVPEVE